MKEEKIIRKYAERVRYTDSEIEAFLEQGHRTRFVARLARAAAKYSILAEVVCSKNCNSGHTVGQSIVLDIYGNFVTSRCPDRMCVYLISQIAIPVALINERLSEGLEPDDFHFMRHVHCLDVGVDCSGYGEVMLKVQVVPRIKEIASQQVG